MASPALGDPPALAALTTWLAALPAHETESAALRQVAARALAKAARPEAVELVLGLVRDDDPGVRIAALTALMAGGDAARHGRARASIASIGERLGRDPWEDVRVRAAQALGGRCARPEPAARLVDRGRRGPRARRADRGARRARAVPRRPASRICSRARGTTAKLPLRCARCAISLAIALGDRALGVKLVGELTAWRGAALESAEALKLAVEAANAIGKLGAPGADRALLDALDDAAFPEIVAAAAGGLGSLGPACPAAAKAEAHGSSATPTISRSRCRRITPRWRADP